MMLMFSMTLRAKSYRSVWTENVFHHGAQPAVSSMSGLRDPA